MTRSRMPKIFRSDTAGKEGVSAPVMLDSLEQELAYQLRRAQEASFAAFARRVGGKGIWPGWYALLAIIGDNPGINQRDLSRAVGRDKSTLTASLRELTKAGLIERERDEADQRSFRIRLSPAGAAHLAELEQHAAAHNHALDSIVGADNKDLLLNMLRDLAARLGEM